MPIYSIFFFLKYLSFIFLSLLLVLFFTHTHRYVSTVEDSDDVDDETIVNWLWMGRKMNVITNDNEFE